MRPDTLVRQLDAAARSLPQEAVALGRLCEASGGAARGSALVMLSVACVLPLPGVGTVLGLALLALCAGLWRGDATLALPLRAQAWTVPHAAAQRLLAWQSRLYRWAARWSRPRWRHLARLPARSPLALVAASMAGLIVLPIPFGNVLPAASLAVLGLGLVCRDGVVVAFSLLLAALAWGLAVGLVWLTWAAAALHWP
jgi:hypothetical protein